MNKREREERRAEFSRRGFQKEETDIILDAEESCDRLRKELSKVRRENVALKKELSDMVRMRRDDHREASS